MGGLIAATMANLTLQDHALATSYMYRINEYIYRDIDIDTDIDIDVDVDIDIDKYTSRKATHSQLVSPR